MGKFRVLLVILVITVFAFRLWQTTGCKKFTDFHFQPISVKADVESAINVDSGGKIVPRFFHNKITYGLFDFSKTYFLTLQPSYLLELLGPVGLVLSVLAGPKAVYFKSKILLVNLFMILLFSLFLIIILAAFLSFYQLGKNPRSLNWDEASNAYNAYSILKTGHDEYGKFLPRTFKSFGDYNLALSVYPLVPSIGLFSLNEFAIRFPSALFGVLTVLV